MRNVPASKARSFSFHVHLPLLEGRSCIVNDAEKCRGGEKQEDKDDDDDVGLVASQKGAPCCAAASVATALNFLHDDANG